MYVGIKVLSKWALVGQSISSNREEENWLANCLCRCCVASRVLFECYGLYIVGGVQWALNGLGNRRVENKSCSTSQFSPGAPGCSVLLVLNHSDVARTTLTPQRSWCRSSGKDGVGGSTGSVRYWKTASLSCRLIPPSHLHSWPFINSLSLATSSPPSSQKVQQLPLGGLLCCQHC